MLVWTYISSFHVPCIKTVFLPVGAFIASWSKVRISPPALRIRARALDVTRSAQTYSKDSVRSIERLCRIHTSKHLQIHYREFRKRVQTGIIDHGSNNNGDTILTSSVWHQLSDFRQRYRWAVNLRHEQSLQNDTIEFGIRSADQKSV